MKKIFFISGGEKLSKDAMRQIVGANTRQAPSSPKGSASANSSLASNNCYGAMCCWEDQPDVCSECVETNETYCTDYEAFLAPCDCRP